MLGEPTEGTAAQLHLIFQLCCRLKTLFNIWVCRKHTQGCIVSHCGREEDIIPAARCSSHVGLGEWQLQLAKLELILSAAVSTGVLA